MFNYEAKITALFLVDYQNSANGVFIPVNDHLRH